jgi:hypothetical protein
MTGYLKALKELSIMYRGLRITKRQSLKAKNKKLLDDGQQLKAFGK